MTDLGVRFELVFESDDLTQKKFTVSKGDGFGDVIGSKFNLKVNSELIKVFYNTALVFTQYVSPLPRIQ